MYEIVTTLAYVWHGTAAAPPSFTLPKPRPAFESLEACRRALVWHMFDVGIRVQLEAHAQGVRLGSLRVAAECRPAQDSGA